MGAFASNRNIFVHLKVKCRRTGIVYNVTPSAVGVIVYKVVGNRYIEKRVNLRVEHVRHSKCRQEFLDRVKSNHDAHVAAKEKGGKCCFCNVMNGSMLIQLCRASELETYPCPPPRSQHRLHPEERASDDGSCSIRNNYLGGLPSSCCCHSPHVLWPLTFIAHMLHALKITKFFIVRWMISRVLFNCYLSTSCGARTKIKSG